MANLVKLFTSHQSVFVDTAQLASGRTHLTIYTSHGNCLKDVGATQEIRENARYGVHRDNLYASKELADAATDAIFRELFGDNALTTEHLRESKNQTFALSP